MSKFFKVYNYSHSFKATILIFYDNVDLPKGQKFMEQNFDLGAGFRAMVQNGPIMAQNGKNLTTPTVFKVWSLFFRIMLTHPRPKKIIEQNFDPDPGFWAMVQNEPKWPKTEKVLLLSQFSKYEAHFLGWCWPTQGPKNHRTELWSGSRFLGYGSKRARNGPKRKRSNYYHSLSPKKLLFLFCILLEPFQGVGCLP